MSDQLAIDFEAAEVEAAPSLDALVNELSGAPSIGLAFQAMEWAEETIEEAQKRWPERSYLLDRAFRCLQPQHGMMERGFQGHAVKAHMAELLARIGENGKDADLGPATAMEACTAFCEASLSAPLKHRHHMAYAAVFIEAFGEERARELVGDELVRRALEDRQQQVIAEIIDSTKAKMSDEERGKLWKKIASEATKKERAA